MEREGSLRRSIQSRLRLGGGSSCSLQDLSQAVGGGLAEDSGKKRAGSNATWNSIHNAVIAVFQRKQLPDDELFSLNEGVRQLLKTELGLFFAEYLQNLLTKGVVILRDKIRLYEGQKLLDSCAETWTFFFCDILSMLQAIFYPVQGKEPSVRQMALLHFRNIITLNLKLDEALSRPRARVPPSIVQMLLVLQGVHESKGVTDDYVRLECLVQKVVSPYLSTNGLWSADEQSLQCCLLERHYRSSRTSAPPAVKNPVVRSKSYNVPVLTPVVESDPDSSTGSGVRRHSVCEMTSCLEESVPVAEPSLHTCNTCMDHQRAPSFTGAVTSEPRHRGDRPVLPSSPGILPDPWSCDSATLLHDTESGASPDVLRARESLDSEPEHDGLFLNFSRDTHS